MKKSYSYKKAEQRNPAPQDLDILNSRRKRPSLHTNNRYNTPYPAPLAQQEAEKKRATTFSFKTRMGPTEGPTMTLARLEELNPDLVDDWVTQLKTLININQYSFEESKDIIKILTSNDLHYITENKKDVDDIIDAIYTATYPRELAYVYENILDAIKLNQYRSISDFKRDFLTNIKRLNFCYPKKESFTDRERYAYFEKSTDNKIKYLLFQNRIVGLKEAFEFLEREESFNIKYNAKPLVYTPHNPHDNKADINKTWCKHHRSPFHNTKDCYQLKKIEKQGYTSKNDQREKNQTNNLFITETKPTAADVILKINIGGITVDMLVDTGSKHNFISEATLRKIINAEVTQLSTPKRVLNANDELTIIDKAVTLEFYFCNIPDIIITAEFLILKKMPIEGNLGLSFLYANKGLVDFEKQTIKLNNFTFSYDTNDQQDIDKEISKLIHSKNIVLKEKNKIAEIIYRAKQNSPNIGCIPNIEHRITLLNETPIVCKEYPLPINLRETVRTELYKMINNKIIRKSTSDYSFPAFPIKKKDGSVRLVVDYRKLNNITKEMVYPFPDLRYQLLELKGSEIFSQIDLCSGYYQIKVQENDIKKTSFVIDGNQYEFLRMPFGLSNAPRTFQRAMKDIFGHLNYIKIFLDDLLIHSRSINEHYIHLVEIFKLIEENNIKINFEKSKFMQEEVVYLGNIINKNGIRAEIKKIEHLEKIDTKPRTIKELQKILGLLNWFRPYVYNLSNKLSPITDKLKLNNINKWTENDSKTPQKIVEQIKQNVILHHPDYDKPFYVFSDASDKGISCVVTQDHGVIGMYSKKYSEAERNYSIVEKECLGVIKGITHFRTILFNSKIILYTDNRNITFQKSLLSSRWQRWKILLEEFNYEIRHIEGKKNTLADFFPETS